jgi:hypothetical protein
MNFADFTTWPVWLQIHTGFVAWVSLYPWTSKTRRGQRAHFACALGAILFYFLFLRRFHH